MSDPIIFEPDAALPVVHATLGFSMGSLVDPEGKEGATSLLFRLIRRCADGLDPLAVEQRLDELGASVSVDVARSVAAIEGTCLSRSFPAMMDLLHSMVAKMPDSEDELRRLKSEAIAEWVDSLDNDALVARRWYVRKVFDGHAYSRPTTGTPTSIERIELNDLATIFQTIALRPRILASFSGNVERAEVDRKFGELARSLSDEVVEGEPDVDDPELGPGRHLYFVDKPQRSQVQVLIGTNGAHPRDPDRTALYIGNTIFGGTFGARLSREVRVKRGWSYGAYSQLAHDRKRQSFSIWTFPQASDAAACVKLELQLLEQLVAKGVSQSELKAAKKYLLNSHAFAGDTASKRASLQFDQRIYGLPPSATFKERVSAVTVDQVNDALRLRLDPKRLAIVVLGTKEELLSSIESAIPSLQNTEVIPYDKRD